jgi:hypothetical protein
MNKKNIFLIGFMSLLIVFGLVFANAKNGSDDVFGEDESSDISEATASINSTEVAMSDDDLSSEKVSFDKRTISSGNGWINQFKFKLFQIIPVLILNFDFINEF